MNKKLKTIIIAATLLAAGTAARAQGTEDTLTVARAAFVTDSTDQVALPQGELLTSKIKLLVRTYGDRVYLRWVPEDYVSWMFLTIGGVNVLRSKPGSIDVDTLAYALKPLSQAEFQAKYGTDDDQANIAMGVLYGEGRIGHGQTEDPPGTMGASVEVNNEQDISFGFAMLVAEWRPDLAQDMAVGLIDRTARQGETYEYIVQPTVWDTKGKIIFEPGVRSNLVNRPFRRIPYDPQLEDTLTSPRRFVLSWEDKYHSSYEVERRYVGPFGQSAGSPAAPTPWQRVNEKPYVPMLETDFEGLCLYSDSVTHDGIWEYRVLAHDAFGELTDPSPVHRVYARDIEPPAVPQIKQFAIIREDLDQPMKRVEAAVVWTNPEVPSEDCTGYMLFYHNNQLTGDQWQPVSEGLIAPTDTVAVIDVTGLQTGEIAIRAYDDSGNEAISLPQMIRVRDYKAPDAPDSLKATVLDDGYVILTWQAPRDADVAGYDVAFANDSTHTFLRLNAGQIAETGYVDSLALDANQKYVYYKVRAIDWSTNVGQWSPALQVERPHATPPSQPHLDTSAHTDEDGMYMRWVVGRDADMKYHILWRRVGEQGEWEELQRWSADSLAALGAWAVDVRDNPRHNRQERYYYRVESFNASPYTTQSLAVSWLHQGPKYFDIPLTLSGDYIGSEGKVRLVWDMGRLPAALQEQPYYFCVFRRTAGKKSFEYLGNVPQDVHEFTERRLLKGETAEYYVMIRFSDGRESQASNTITVQRPE